VRQADGLRLLAEPPDAPYDLVFLDPPFAAGLLGRVALALEAQGWLAPGASIYLEHDAAHPWPELPANWTLHREGRAGQAAYRLMKRMRSGDADC
jgi:16S rRNA (guanine966-N2)-methyltransferase